jgi:hypothetical protein
MNWPSRQDFTDALRNPATAFADAELAAGDVVVGPDGRPLALAGESSVVVQVCAAEDDRSWAVKCFTRPAFGLSTRYQSIRAELDRAAPPFAVPFTFLDEGVKVGEKWCPVLKMDWVEGVPLNVAVRERAGDPAALEALFGQWVSLCTQLRRAGIAHGDLHHAHVLVVPGATPDDDALRLIDYDGMVVPALATAPAGESGHANYRHPARAAGADAPDLDRFPLLVVGTALQALAALGPRLWEKYDTGDNLLFTAADFQNPAASPLVHELRQNGRAALRRLLEALVASCNRPIAETPWLDDLAAAGLDAPLAAAEGARDAASALGLAAVPVAQPPTPPPVEVLSLDDEPAGAEPPRAASHRPPKARPQPQRTRGIPLVPAAIAGGLLLLTGVIAGALIARSARSPETAETPSVEPAPKPAPAPALPEPRPDEPAPRPRPNPPEPKPPVPQGPPGFHQVWAKPFDVQRDFIKVTHGADGRSVFVATRGKVEVFDARTGEPGPVLQGGDMPLLPVSVWSLDRDRVAVFGYPLKSPGVWDAKTGRPLPPLLSRDPLPPPTPDAPVSSAVCELSPDGRFLFVGNQGLTRNGTFGPSQYRVVEVATEKVVAGSEWRFGSARFTADGSRMLLAESTGRVCWVKLPSGEAEVEWAFPQIVSTQILAGLSGDGSVVNYFGRPGGLPVGNYLLDGNTGQVLRRLAHGSSAGRSAVTADGRWVVAVLIDPPDHRPAAVVADARTGEVLVRTPLGEEPVDVVQADFTPDGKSLVVHNRGKGEVAVYALRGAVPAVPAGARVPSPLTPVPEPARPGGAVGGGPPMPPVPPVPPVRAGLPVAPAIAPRLSIAAGAEAMANGLPQPPLYSKDGGTIVLSGGTNGTVLTFDAKSGAAGPVYEGHKGPGGVLWLSAFGENRVASGGFDGKNATWDTKTGQRVDDVKFAELPPLPAGQAGHAGLTRVVSPGGRYTVLARKEAGRPAAPGPLRILDTTTGRVVVSARWNGGRVAFAADESRVFVLDGLGRAAWYKLPSGEVDGEWKVGDGLQAETARLLGTSANGRTLLYHGPVAGQPVGVYLLDGRTGQVLRKLGGAPYQASISALSADGRFVVMGVIDFARGPTWYADLFEVAGWRLVGRISAPARGERSPPQFGFAPDGKELAVFYPQARELRVFPLPAEGARAAVKPVPGEVPVLKPRWVGNPASGNTIADFLLDADARVVVLSNAHTRQHDVVDARTGESLPERVRGIAPTPGGELFPLAGGRVGVLNSQEREIAVWDLKAGKVLERVEVPEIPDGHNLRRARLSPDGKFLAVGRRPRGAPGDPLPLRIFDAKTKKAVVSTDWTGGTIHFTADSSRVLVAESGGRCRWFKLPSGEADGGFDLGRPGPAREQEVNSISADGRLVGYTGPGTGAERVILAVLDGKTGAVVRSFGAEYFYTSPVYLSADGRLAAVMRKPPGVGSEITIDVVSVSDGRVVGRAVVETQQRSVPMFRLTPDGKALLVHDYNGQNLYWFDVPDRDEAR